MKEVFAWRLDVEMALGALLIDQYLNREKEVGIDIDPGTVTAAKNAFRIHQSGPAT